MREVILNNKFKEYKLCDEIIKALDGIGYKKPSDVQREVIPQILTGKDIVVKMVEDYTDMRRNSCK